jgi:hypothetical protein
MVMQPSAKINLIDHRIRVQRRLMAKKSNMRSLSSEDERKSSLIALQLEQGGSRILPVLMAGVSCISDTRSPSLKSEA